MKSSLRKGFTQCFPLSRLFFGDICFQHMRGHMRLFLYMFAFAMGVCGSSMVAAETLTSRCAITADGASVGCDFRMHAPAAVKRAAIKANGNDLADARYTSFEDSDGKAAWFLLVDRSDPARSAAVKRSVALVKDLYSQSNARNIMGIGTFAEDLRVSRDTRVLHDEQALEKEHEAVEEHSE